MKKREKTLLAKNIILRRKALGFASALAFSKHAKIPYGTLRDIEAGYSEGWRDTREAIAKALNCSVDDLTAPYVPNQQKHSLQKEHDASPQELIDGAYEIRVGLNMVEAFARLSPQLRKIVLSIVYQDPSYIEGLSLREFPEWLAPRALKRRRPN